MVVFVIYNTELPGCHPLNEICGMYHIFSRTCLHHSCCVELWGVAYFECHIFHFHFLCQEMKMVYLENIAVGGARFISFAHVEDVGVDVLAHDKPRPSAEAEAMPLADRLCLTLVDDEPQEADAFFPDFSEWREVWREEHTTDERHGYNYAFVDFVRE